MDKAKLSELRGSINEALALVAEGAGNMTLRLGNVTYNSDGFRGTVICEETQEGNGLPERYKTEWDEAVAMGIVKAEHFGVITGRGDRFEVVGYDFNKPKNCIMLRKVGTDRIYKTGMRHFNQPAFKVNLVAERQEKGLQQIG